MTIQKRIAFIGGGNMAEALIKGMLAAGTMPPDRVMVSDISAERLEHLRTTYGIIVLKNNREAIGEPGILVLCVKPQVMEKVLAELGPAVHENTLIISVAAGVTISAIEKALGGPHRVVRVMPNTPALVLAGAAALAPGKNATQADLAAAQEILSSVGRAVVVEERLMDAVTGLSGSGPAYVFTFIEALADAGVEAGLTRQLALELSAQTVLGAAKMVVETKEHPGKLRDMVTSPGGTTIAGLHALEEGNFRATVMNAVVAATARSKELGKG